MNELYFTFHRNFRDINIDFCPYGPLLYRHLPEDSKKISLRTGHSDYVLSIWFKRTGKMSGDEVVYSPTEKTIDDSKILRQAVLDAGILFCGLIVKNIDDEQFQAVCNNKIDDKNYIRFADQLLPIIIPPVNNFLKILKNEYSQYWIKEIKDFDSRHESLGNYYSNLRMKWGIEQNKIKSDFRPTGLRISAVSYASSGQSFFQNYLREDEWNDIIDNLDDDFNPSLALKTLNKSWQNFDQGDIVRSIIDAITALEIAIAEEINSKLARFNKSINDIGDIKESDFSNKVTFVTSYNDLITEDDLAKSLELYGIRNKIVHNGFEPDVKSSRPLIMHTLSLISKLLLKRSFKFASTNSGNKFTDVAVWEKDEEEFRKNINLKK